MSKKALTEEEFYKAFPDGLSKEVSYKLYKALKVREGEVDQLTEMAAVYGVAIESLRRAFALMERIDKDE